MIYDVCLYKGNSEKPMRKYNDIKTRIATLESMIYIVYVILMYTYCMNQFYSFYLTYFFMCVQYVCVQEM